MFLSVLVQGTAPTSPVLGGSDCATGKNLHMDSGTLGWSPRKDSPVLNKFYKGLLFPAW